MSTPTCAVCKKKATDRCSRCFSVAYCGPDHQKDDWEKHQTVCVPKPIRKCAVCEKNAILPCHRCQSAWYCGEEHRIKNWPKHDKTSCTPFQVKESPYLGSFVVATRDIKKGEIIVNEEPLAVGPHYLFPAPCCLGCLQSKSYNEHCPVCLWPVCSKNCPGLKDPLFHGAECDFLAQTKSWMLSPEVILPLRILLLQKNNPKKWDRIQEMAIKAIPRIRQSKTQKNLETFKNTVLEPIYRYSVPTFPMDSTPAAMSDIFSVLQVHGLELKLLHTNSLLVVSEIASTMEHSCLPNTRRVVNLTPPTAAGPFQCRIIIRAVRDIKKGEHLTASIVRNLMSTWDRQKSLWDSRGLLCSCARCLDPRELGTDFNTLKCETCPGDVLPLDLTDILNSEWQCKQCRCYLAAEYLPDLIRTLSKEDEDDKTNVYSVAQLEGKLKEHLKYFHTNHYYCIKLKMRLYNLYGTQHSYEELLCKRMSELGMSTCSVPWGPGLTGASDADLERKAELCRQVLRVIGNPRFESSHGALDGCLTQLAVTITEIARRKKAQGEWTAERAEAAFDESRAMMISAMEIQKLQVDNMMGAADP